MKEKYLKIIFTILLVILICIALYIYIFKDTEKTITTGKLKLNKTNILISNDIRIGIIKPDNINPILSNNKNVQDISRLIFEPLFTLSEEYRLEGILAKECSKIADKTYIIKLNENIVWHDDEKFDSSDVIFTINILQNLKEKSVYYHNVKNIIELQKIDEYAIKLKTNSEIPYFEYNLIFPIISSKYFNEENINSKSKNIKPVGTGLFYISDVNNKSILLKKNIKSLNSNELKIETITLKLYNSLSDSIDAFKSEEIDIFTTSNENIEEYLKNTSCNTSKYVNREYNYIALNCNNDILSNIEIRQAINYAIDKEKISKEVFNNNCKISNFPLDFGSFSYNNNNNVINFDDNLAKNLLVQKGWKYSNDGWSKKIGNKNLKIKLDIVVNKNELDNIKVANNIKKQLSEVGIILEIKKVSEKEYNNYLKNKNYDMIIEKSNYGYSPSLEKYFGENNLANYTNEEINTLLKEAKLSNDENEIKEKYTKIVEIYNKKVPYISVYYDTNFMVYSSNLKGTVTPNSYNLFYGIESWYREYEK